MNVLATAANYGFTEGMGTSLKNAFTTVAENATSSIQSALPIALGVVGAILAITLAVKFFKGLLKK